MNVHVVNGPNLNILERRESVYGGGSLRDIESGLIKEFPAISFSFFQSNIEGEIVGFVQNAAGADALIINAGAYSHYSYAIRDALAALKIPKIEVHLSNIWAREDFRKISVISGVCDGVISGFKADGYNLAAAAAVRMKGGQ
jgi:3-dehydroquinate dehydratase-2